VDREPLAQQLDFVALFHEGAIDAEQAEVPIAVDQARLFGIDGMTDGRFADGAVEVKSTCTETDPIHVELRASDKFHRVGWRGHQDQLDGLSGP
ncbi:hypothetical protein, partial [Streptococcus agalactiae]|uniref:hypothetical protein n=1 Tax=Streptococcus agalactiae TaxID=1311 RepID=UPI00210C29A9